MESKTLKHVHSSWLCKRIDVRIRIELRIDVRIRLELRIDVRIHLELRIDVRIRLELRIDTIMYLDMIESPVESRLRNKSKILKEFVYKLIPKVYLRCYI